MGKTKTAFVTGVVDEKLSSEDKYKQKQLKKKGEEEKEKGSVTGIGLKGGERIKVVGAEEPVIEKKDEEKAEEIKGSKKPKVRGKKYKDARAKVDRDKLYKIKDAVDLVKDTSFSKFDGTMELHLVVKNQNLNVKVELPHFKAKEKKIEIANENTIKKLKKGNIDFDLLLATPQMMPKIVPFAKLLGPKGLMPNPKTGTVIKNVKEAEEFKKSNSINIKCQKGQPVAHTVCGKVSQKTDELAKNIEQIIDKVGKKQIEKAYLKSTMSPSVKISL